MNWFDRLILFVSPTIAVQRAEAKRRLDRYAGRRAARFKDQRHLDTEAAWRRKERAHRGPFISIGRRTQ